MPSQSQETHPPPVAILRDWYVCQKYPDSFCVQLVGYNVNVDRTALDQEQFVTSMVDRRITSSVVSTMSGSVYKIDGPVDEEMMTVEGYSKRTIKLFSRGFPANWEAFLEDDLIERQSVQLKRPARAREVLEDPDPVEAPSKKLKRQPVLETAEPVSSRPKRIILKSAMINSTFEEPPVSACVKKQKRQPIPETPEPVSSRPKRILKSATINSTFEVPSSDLACMKVKRQKRQPVPHAPEPVSSRPKRTLNSEVDYSYSEFEEPSSDSARVKKRKLQPVGKKRKPKPVGKPKRIPKPAMSKPKGAERASNFRTVRVEKEKPQAAAKTPKPVGRPKKNPKSTIAKRKQEELPSDSKSVCVKKQNLPPAPEKQRAVAQPKKAAKQAGGVKRKWEDSEYVETSVKKQKVQPAPKKPKPAGKPKKVLKSAVIRPKCEEFPSESRMVPVEKPKPVKRTVGWFNNLAKSQTSSMMDSTTTSTGFFFSQLNSFSDSPLAASNWSINEDDEFSPLKFTDTTRTFRMSAGRPAQPKRKSTYEPANATSAADRLNFQGFLEMDKNHGKETKNTFVGRKRLDKHAFAVPALPRELRELDE